MLVSVYISKDADIINKKAHRHITTKAGMVSVGGPFLSPNWVWFSLWLTQYYTDVHYIDRLKQNFKHK